MVPPRWLILDGIYWWTQRDVDPRILQSPWTLNLNAF